MMKTRLQEDLMIGDLEGLVLDKLLIEILKPRAGEQKENVVFSIIVKQRGPAFELFRFIKEGYFNIKNIEASNTPDERGNYLVSVTSKKHHNLFDVMDGILKYIKQLVNINKWYFILEDTDEHFDWNRKNFSRAIDVPSEIDVVKDILRAGITDKNISKDRSYAKGSIDNGGIEKIIEQQLSRYGKTFIESLQDQVQAQANKKNNLEIPSPSREEIEEVIKKHITEYSKTFTKSLEEQFRSVKKITNSPDPKDTGKKEIEEFIGKQLSRQSKVFIKSLQGQIRTIKHDNTRLSKYIDDLKSDQQNLYQQLQLYQKREKIAILREQEDYKRIRVLEKKLAILAPPDNNKVEIVIPPADASKKEINEKIYDTSLYGFGSDKTGIDEDKIKQIIENTVESITKRMVTQEKIKSRDAEIKDSGADIEETASTVVETDFDGSSEETASKYEEIIIPDDKETNARGTKKATSVDIHDGIETTSESKLVDEYFALGMAASEKKEYSEAIKYYSKVTEILPDAPPSFFNLSVLYYRLGEYEKARNFAQKAIDLGAKSAKFIIEKIDSKLKSIKIDSEIIETEESPVEEKYAKESAVLPVEDLEIVDKDIESDGIAESEEIDEGDSKLEMELSKDDQDVNQETTEPSQTSDAGKEFFALGLLASEHKEYRKAIKFFSKSTKLMPNSPLSYLNMAVLYYRLKEFEIAKKHAKRAQELGAKPAGRVLKNINTKLEKSGEKTQKTKDEVFIGQKEEATEEEYIKPEFIEEVDEDISKTEKKVTVFENNKTELTNDIEDKVVSETTADEAIAITEIAFSDTTLEEKDSIDEPDDLEPVPEEDIKKEEIYDPVALSNAEATTLEGPDSEYIYDKESEIQENTDPEIEQVPIFEDSIAHETEPLEVGEIEDSTNFEVVPQEEAKIEEPAVPETAALEADKKTEDSTVLDFTQQEVTKIEAPAATVAEPREDTKTIDTNDQDQVTIETKESPVKESTTPDEYFAMGLEASDQKDYRKAIEFFMKVTDLLPDASPSFFNLANLHLHLKNYESAKKYAQRAVVLGAGPAARIIEKIDHIIKKKPVNKKGKKTKKPKHESKPGETQLFKDEIAASKKTHFGIEKETKEQPVIEKQDQVNVEPPPAELKKTDIIEKDIHLKESKKVSEKTSPKTPKDYFLLGLSASEKKEYEKAIKYFHKVIDVLPNSPPSLINLSVLYYRLKDFESATKHAKAALKLGEDSAKRILKKIEFKIKKKLDTNYSVETVEPPTEEVFIWGADDFDGEAAFTENEFNRDDENKKVQNEVLKFGQTKLDSDIIELESESIQKTKPLDKIFASGLKASENKEYYKAIEIFTKVLETIPDSAPAYLNLAILNYRIKEYDTARKHALHAIELGADTADKILVKIEKKLEKPKKIKKAEKVGKKPIKNLKDKPKKIEKPVHSKKEKIEPPPIPTDTNKSFETLKIETERIGPPIEIVPSIIEKKSEPRQQSVNEYFALGLEASENKEYEKAIEYFSIVTDLLPDAPPSFLNLANLYLDLKDFNNAKQNAEKAFDLGSQSAVLILDKIEAAQNSEAKTT